MVHRHEDGAHAAAEPCHGNSSMSPAWLCVTQDMNTVLMDLRADRIETTDP